MRRLPVPRLAAALLVAGVLNAALLFLALPMMSRLLTPIYNQNVYADGYELIAFNLTAGYGYRFYPDTAPTLMREPGYPLLLAVVLKTSGGSFAAVKLANFCFVCLAALWMVRLATSFGFDSVTSSAAVLLFLFHPGVLVAESRGGVEALFTALLVLFVLSRVPRARTQEVSRLRDLWCRAGHHMPREKHAAAVSPISARLPPSGRSLKGDRTHSNRTGRGHAPRDACGDVTLDPSELPSDGQARADRQRSRCVGARGTVSVLESRRRGAMGRGGSTGCAREV